MLIKKIIFIHLFNDRSGSPKVLSQVIKACQKKNISTEVITSPHQDGFLNNVADFQRTLFYKRSENKYLTLLYYIIAQIYLFLFCLRYWRQDVIFYINTMMPMGAALAAKLMRKPVLYHLHETSVNSRLLKRFLRMVIRLTAQKVIFVSNYLKKVEGFVTLDQIVVSNALDPISLRATPRKGRDSNTKKPFNVLMVCSLKIYKGLLEFLEIAKLFSSNPDFSFTLVINATTHEIDHYLQKVIIPGNVFLHPRQANMTPYYTHADTVLNLSRPDECIETFGLTIIEAMGFGLPVIVPPIGGPAEIVCNDQEGYLVSCYETEKIAQLITQLSGDQVKYSQLAANAKKRAKDFNQTTFENGIYNVFNQYSFF